jgi:hypothetical protein
MDNNLIKIRDHNIKAIRRGKLAIPMAQAKHYLSYILTEFKQEQIDKELTEFELHLRSLRKEKSHGQESQEAR